MRNRIQAYDSTFSWYPTRRRSPCTTADVATKVASRSSASPVFDDHTATYYDASNPHGGVKVTDTNTRISIVKEPLDGSTIDAPGRSAAK